MSTYVDAGSRTDSRSGRAIPAHGPLDAVLGFVLFYIVVDRATPTIVDVMTEVLPNVSPSLVGLGLASVLWFILVVTVIDQIRRQLAALGVGTHSAVSLTETRTTLTEAQALLYLALALVGSIVAVWTFDPAMETTVSMIRIVATIDVVAFVPADFVVMAIFFVSFGVTTRALDRLLIGGIRAMLAD
ncbi:hypothetical protein [Haladaptatus sp. NG-SE-30]